MFGTQHEGLIMVSDDLRRDAWHGGQLLAFSAIDGPTEFDHSLTARTAFDCPGIDVKLPAECRVRFPGAPATNHFVAGDWFRLGDGADAVRGVFLDANHLLIEGVCNILGTAAEIKYLTRGNRTLIAPAARFDASKITADIDAATRDRARWLNSVRLPSCKSDATRRTLVKTLSIMKTQVCSPEGQIRHRWTTPDRWPHQRLWIWDSVFHAIGLRHIDVQLARDAISAVLDTQAPDGFIAHMMAPFENSTITQPPVLALGVKLVNDTAPDAEWVRGLYPKLCAYVEWDITNRDVDGDGLVEWFTDNDPNCRCGESGMDNSPRFDTPARWDATDFNSFIALECETLAGFAESLGLSADAAKWKSRHANICRLINEKLWSDRLNFYVDYDIDRHVQSPVLASSGFLPLICGAASGEQAARLADALRAPEMFGTPCPVPSIAAKDTAHYQKDMWRGPVWVNINWLIAFGFDRCGLTDVAAELKRQTMREVEAWFEKLGTIFEFFDDRQEVAPPALLRKGQCAPEVSFYHQVFYDYGFTATLYADLVYSGQGAE